MRTMQLVIKNFFTLIWWVLCQQSFVVFKHRTSSTQLWSDREMLRIGETSNTEIGYWEGKVYRKINNRWVEWEGVSLVVSLNKSTTSIWRRLQLLLVILITARYKPVPVVQANGVSRFFLFPEDNSHSGSVHLPLVEDVLLTAPFYKFTPNGSVLLRYRANDTWISTKIRYLLFKPA